MDAIRYSAPEARSPTNPMQLMIVVRRSPVCGVKNIPRIIRPSTNMRVIETSSRAPRPDRLRKKCPPPGTIQPISSGLTHTLIGGILALPGVVSLVAITFFTRITRGLFYKSGQAAGDENICIEYYFLLV